MTASYTAFLQSKRIAAVPSGFDVAAEDLNPHLFLWQKAMVRWALQRGKAALFCRYGTGKTIMLLAWAEQIVARTNKPVLVLAPLGAGKQTANVEAPKFGFDAVFCADQSEVPARAAIVVTNYEKLHRFDPRVFGGVVLDEGSIIKDFMGKTRTLLIEAFQQTPYRLICTATPAPNDYAELGNHAQFLGIMRYSEMLSSFFEHDGGDTSKWKMMAWGEKVFWEWLASWAMVLRRPSDLGYDDTGYDLPPLTIHTLDVAIQQQHIAAEGAQMYLLPVEARGLAAQRNARKISMHDRLEAMAALINASTEQWIVWGDTNPECDLAEKLIRDAVQVAGTDKEAFKEQSALAFVKGDIRVLVTKASIFGHGLNWQHCHNAAYLGWSNSFELFDQSLHRIYRYGQQQPVHVHIATTEMDGSIKRNIERKRSEYEQMMDKVLAHTRALNMAAVQQSVRHETAYQPGQAMRLPLWVRSEVAQ